MTTKIDVDAVTALLKSTSVEDDEQPTFADLYKCCEDETAETLRKLLSKLPEGFLVNQADENEATPLMIASYQGRADIVGTLLAFGASIDKRNAWDQTPLFFAAAGGHKDVMELLLSREPCVDAADVCVRTPLVYAAERGHTDLVELLLSRGASIDAVDGVGRTPLIHAAAQGHTDVVELLVSRGASVNAVDWWKQTPVSFAAEQGHADVVELLLCGGASVDAMDEAGRTPLYIAAERCHSDVAELLLSRGAGVDAKNKDGRTPLSIAAERCQSDVVKLLLSRGSSVAAVDDLGRTPLLYAAKEGHTDVVELLLSRGASVDVVDTNGRTPLYSAAELAHRAVVKALLSRCPTASDESLCSCMDPAGHSGTATLLAAARDGSFDAVRVLLEAGVSPVVRAADGETPLISAARLGDLSIVLTLFDMGWLTRWEIVKDGTFKVQQGLPSSAGSATSPTPPPASAPPSCSRQTSLLSLTLQSLSEYAEQVHEFKSMWSRLAERLSRVHAQLFDLAGLSRARGPSAVADGEKISTRNFGIHSGSGGAIELKCECDNQNESKNDDHFQFAMIAFHFAQLKTACSSANLFARLVASTDVTAQIRDINTELSFLEPPDIPTGSSSWDPAYLVGDEVALLALFRVKITKSGRHDWFVGESADTHDEAKMLGEAATLLKHKITAHSESCNVELLKLLKLSLGKVLNESGTSSASVASFPDWFIPPHELDVDIDLLHEKYIKRQFSLFSRGSEVITSGRWTGSIVMPVYMPRDEFTDIVNTCYKLNHPNVIKLYGASYTSSGQVVVVEKVLSNFREYESRDETAPEEAHQKMLEVALGLQYLAERGIELTTLWLEDVWIDNDDVAKILVFRCSERWKRQTHPEGLSPTAPTSVHALGEMINVKHQSVPALRRLAEQMKHEDPKHIPTITTVVLELKHIVEQQKNKSPPQPSQQDDRIQSVTPGSSSLDKIRFLELGMTLHEYVEYLERKCRQYKDSRDAVDKIFERIRNLLGVIQAQSKSRGDVAVSSFINVLVEFNRFLGTAVSNTSVMLRAKSQKVSLESHVFHRRLDEMVTLLSPGTVDAAHLWQIRAARRARDLRSTIEEDDDEDLQIDECMDAFEKEEADVGTGFSSDASHTSPRGGRDQASATGKQPAARERPVKIKRFDTSEKAESVRGSKEVTDIGFPTAGSVAAAVMQPRKVTTTQDGTKSTKSSPVWLIHVHELQYDPSQDKIGVGSFGAVYKATWRNTPVVVKLMGYEADADAYDRELFAHELRVWFPLSHPHVLKLFGACDVGKRYFVCEHAGGGNLLEYVKKSDAKSPRRWQLLQQVARGLQYLHEQNVVHNDLKCDNVLIGANGDAKIIDFGLSSLLHHAEVTVDPKRQGALQWRSPEYIRGERVTLASDVYSFGMLIVELMSGAPPWGRSTIDAMVRFRVVKKGLLPMQPPGISDTQWTLIRMMCASEATQRVTIAFVVSKLNQIFQQQQ